LGAQVAAVLAFLEEGGKPCPRPGAKPFQRLEQGIRFDKVSFACLDRRPALQAVGLEIAKGKATALAGRSGAGKSALIGLVGRSYDPCPGQIWADGAPLDDLDVREWRGRIALVGQDVHIFSASVRENAAYGKLDASEEEFRRRRGAPTPRSSSPHCPRATTPWPATGARACRAGSAYPSPAPFCATRTS
jgi:ABC-type multidrug transport system fused ATPase/permease subunit